MQVAMQTVARLARRSSGTGDVMVIECAR